MAVILLTLANIIANAYFYEFSANRIRLNVKTEERVIAISQSGDDQTLEEFIIKNPIKVREKMEIIDHFTESGNVKCMKILLNHINMPVKDAINRPSERPFFDGMVIIPGKLGLWKLSNS